MEHSGRCPYGDTLAPAIGVDVHHGIDRFLRRVLSDAGERAALRQRAIMHTVEQLRESGSVTGYLIFEGQRVDTQRFVTLSVRRESDGAWTVGLRDDSRGYERAIAFQLAAQEARVSITAWALDDTYESRTVLWLGLALARSLGAERFVVDSLVRGDQISYEETRSLLQAAGFVMTTLREEQRFNPEFLSARVVQVEQAAFDLSSGDFPFLLMSSSSTRDQGLDALFSFFSPREVRLLDMGTGRGFFLPEIGAWFLNRGIPVRRLAGIDYQPANNVSHWLSIQRTYPHLPLEFWEGNAEEFISRERFNMVTINAPMNTDSLKSMVQKAVTVLLPDGGIIWIRLEQTQQAGDSTAGPIIMEDVDEMLTDLLGRSAVQKFIIPLDAGHLAGMSGTPFRLGSYLKGQVFLYRVMNAFPRERGRVRFPSGVAAFSGFIEQAI